MHQNTNLFGIRRINHNDRNLNIQNCFEHLNIDICDLSFVIWCSFQIANFMDRP